MEMREALEAAVTEQEKVDVPEQAAETVPPQEPPTESEGGEVDSGTAGEPSEKVEPTDTPIQKAEVPPAKEEPQQPGQHRVDRAPASWRKEAKGEWAAVPLHIRQEVHRRELEINRALQESTQARQNYDQLQQVITPFMARIQSAGISPTQAIGELLKADYTLATAGKEQRAQFMAKLIKDYDIDIMALDAAIVGGQQQAPQQQASQQTNIQQLIQQQLQQALAPIYQQQQQAQQAQQAQVTQTIEQMSLDPKYPHFDDLREDMADLIEVASRRGYVLSLEDAYNKAASLNPEVSAQMQRQSTLAQANQQHLQAQRAKAAASSVTGSPAGGGSQAHVGDGTLRGDLEAALANMRI